MSQPVHIPGIDAPVHFPDGMTPEQIQAAIEQDILPHVARDLPQVPQRPQEAPSFLERVGHGATRGVDRLVQLGIDAGEAMGLKGYPGPMRDGSGAVVSPGLGDTMTKNVNAEEAKYQQARGPKPGMDVASAIGSAGIQAPLALIPGGPATILGRAFAGGGMGALSGALQFDPTNSIKGTAGQTAVGAATGAVLNPVLGAVSDQIPKAVSALTGRLKGFMEKHGGQATDQAIIGNVPDITKLPVAERTALIAEARQQLSTTGQIDAEALGRKANIMANGGTPTLSMVTRDPTDWSIERNLQKMAQSPDANLGPQGQALTGIYQANDTAFKGQLDKIGSGLPRASSEAQGMTVMNALDSLSKGSQADVSKVYEAVRTAHGDQLASDAKNLVNTLSDLQDNTYADKLVSSVNNKLKRFGMLDANGDLTSNTLTVTQAEELRKFVNKLPNDFGKKDIISAIDADVTSGLGADAFAPARQAAQQRFAMLDNPAAQRALGTLGELSQGKTAQNFISSQVVNGADQDVRSLVNTLSHLPQDKSKEAMDALRAGLIQHIQDKAVNPNSGQLSGAALNKAIDEIGTDKMMAILGPQRYANLRSLAKASLDATYAPPFAAVNNSNTAPTLLSLVQRARTIPGIPLILSEEAQKVAAQSGYKRQIAQAMAAQAPGIPQEVSPVWDQLAQALRKAGIPLGTSWMPQARQVAHE